MQEPDGSLARQQLKSTWAKAYSSMAALRKLLQRWPLFCILTFAFCIWSLVYQLPLAQTIHVGGEVALQRRDDDAPFLRGANGSEPADRVDAPGTPRGYIWWWEQSQRTGQPPYRWTSAETTLLVPGAGGGPYLVEFLARGGRPDGVPTQTLWTPGVAPPLALSLPAGKPRRYHLLAPADSAGDLRVTMQTTPYVAPGDPRELGFVLHEVQLQALGSAPRAPAWPTLGWLALAVSVIYGLARALAVGRVGALALAAGSALLAAAALAAFRPALTVFAPTLALLALSCAALAVLAWPLVQVISGRRSAVSPDEVTQLLALVLLAFALRMGGVLHPQALFSDLGFNANNLYKVSLGEVFLTAGLPSDVGGGRAPYPPGFYVMLLPGELIAVGGAARRLLVQGGAALLDSLSLVLIWALLRRADLGRRAAALGAACYLLPTPALEAFSIGEYANLGGQALALPLLALLGLGLVQADGGRWTVDGRSGTVHRPPSTVLLAAAVAMALLAHSGVALSVGALVGAAWCLAWLRGRNGPVDSLRLTLGAAAGLSLALLLFYSAPLFLGLLAERGPRAEGQGTPPLQILIDTARALVGLAPPEDRRVPLPPLLGLVGLTGLALLALLRPAPPQAPLRALLAAWWLGAALTLALLTLADQGVRWAIFLYPALCLGAGVTLDALWHRGTLGRLAACTALATILAAGLIIWIVTIRDFIHV